MTKEHKILTNKLAAKYILQKCFYTFLKEVYLTLNPGQEFLENWHIKYLCTLLEEVENGKHKNIIINIPPRSLKSTIITVAWTAWMLGKYPNKKIITASYSLKLSTKLSQDCRNVMTSTWYRNAFNCFKIANDQNCKHKFSTTKHGVRIATSVGASIIGEGADILICDDPLSPLQAYSKTYRDRVYDWFMESFSTRLNDKKNGIKIIVMQRLHEDDLCGRILNLFSNKWLQVIIPAIADKDKIYQTYRYKTFIKENAYLHEDREDKEVLTEICSNLGSQAFSAQYLQKPIPLSGNIVKREWINRYEKIDYNQGIIVQSWDLAFTNKSYSDYSACTTWLIKDHNFYLLDVFKAKLEFSSLKKKILNLYHSWDCHYLILEDTVATKALIDDISTNKELNVIRYQPLSDKITRLALCGPIFESGKIHFPESAEWLMDFERELFSFPNCDHDDQVDSVSQFINYSKKFTQQNLNKYILTF